MSDLRTRLIRLAASNPEVRRDVLALLDEGREASETEWRSAPDPAEWRKDRKVSELYGEYVFYLMHHDGSPSQKREIRETDAALKREGFNGYGMGLDMWPLAAKRYLELCRDWNVRPEATRGVGY